ncbi:hypothetical protein [Streptomyces sp. HF10]|nr:hypothetical protein [Streptomyces sp. HF10]QHC28131.1 hypothetical protein GR129_04105 [Streptomyces sp. HF10]
MEYIAGTAGALLLLAVLSSILRTLVVPRGSTPRWSSACGGCCADCSG